EIPWCGKRLCAGGSVYPACAKPLRCIAAESLAGLPRCSTWCRSGLGQQVDVFNFQNLLGMTFEHAVDHGQPHVLHGTDLVRKQRAQYRIKPTNEPVIPFNVSLSRRWLHKTGPEVVHLLKAEFHESILGSSLHARPHDPAFF